MIAGVTQHWRHWQKFSNMEWRNIQNLVLAGIHKFEFCRRDLLINIVVERNEGPSRDSVYLIHMALMISLQIGSYVEGMERRSVGNSHILRESALVEAFNLKVSMKLYSGGKSVYLESRPAFFNLHNKIFVEECPILHSFYFEKIIII